MQNKRKNLAIRATAGALSLSLVFGMVPSGIYAYANEQTAQKAMVQNAQMTPTIATRDAAKPEESEVGNDARDAVHAFVGVQTGGDLNLELSGATGQEFKPIEGVRGYFQWLEDGGYVSPVYTAVSDANGRLNIGAKPYIAADGKLIQFDADPTVSAGNERYRFWVDPDTIPEEYQLQYITGEQVIFPDSGVPITQGGSGSDTPKNTHENWKILLMQKPKASMHREDAKETPVQSDTGGYMTGTVSWDYTSGVGGVQWKFVADHTTPAPGVTVRASYLSDYAMKQIYSAETARLMGVSDASKIRGRGWTSAQEADLQKWVKEQVAKDPAKWIAETVTAKTNAEGKYILQFNGTWGTTRNAEVATDEREVGGKYDGSLHKWTEEEVNRLGTVANDPNEGTFNRGLVNYWNRKHINYDWMFVSTDDSEDLRVMTPYNNNYYTAMNSDWGIHSGWSGVGFGVGVSNAVTSTMKTDFVFGINNVNFDITNYDSTANTALPGDVAETKTTGLPYKKTSERFRIVWYDKDGKVVKEGKAVRPDAKGQIPSEPFDTTGITKTTEFTAKLYRVDKNGKDQELIAVDSFVVQISNIVASRYDDFEIANPNPQENGIYEAEGLPDGLTINPENGTVSGRPTKAGFYNVKISTTIQDEGADIKGSRDYRALITDSPLEHGEVGVEYNQEVKPQAIDGYVFKNVTSKFMEGKEIEGLTIENNKITGTPTKEVPATQTTDDEAMGPNVEVTYDIYKLNSKGQEVLVKKGHKDLVPLEITKADSQAPKYEPVYTDKDATPGTEVTTDAPKFLDQKSEADPKPEAETQPTGVKYTLGDGAPEGATIDADTGKVTYTPSSNDAGKPVEIPVKVTYSDGTTDEATAKINVSDAQNKAYQPEYAEADGTVGQQTTVTAPNFKDGDGQDTQKPDGVEFTLGKDAPEGAKVDKTTGEIKYTPKADEAGTTVRIPVVATYKDGSTDEVEAPIKVVNADRANYEPNYKSVIAQVGHEVTVASPEFLDNDGNVVAKKPAVTKYELGKGVKDGVMINEQTGEIKYTAVDADKATDIVVPVKVTYADGSVDNTTATIVVPSDADFYKPEANPLKTEKGTVPEAEAGIKDKDKLPAGTTYEWASEPNVDKAGSVVGTVKVKYPDGSIDKVDVPVTVTETGQTDAEKNPAVAPEKTEVEDKTKLTPDEKTEVENKVKEKNPKANKVEVGNDGSVTLTYPDGTTNTLTPDQTITEKGQTKPEDKKTSVDDSKVKPVNPTDDAQDTGIIVKNKDKDTKISAKDEDGKDVPVAVDPKTGEIIVKPGKNVDGPITVTVEDPDLTDGKKVIEVPVKGHEKGRDDNGSNSGKDDGGIWLKPVNPTDNNKVDDNKGNKEKHETAIHKLYIYGYKDNTFRPEGNMTRAEAAAMIARLKGLDMSNNAKPNFSDVKSAWYNSSINAVVSAGYMKGYPDGTFAPNGKITRAEFAQMIMDIDKANGAAVPFADVKGHWAEAAIAQAYGNGRIAGYPDSTFRPNNNITRAEAVTVLNKLFDRSVNENGLAAVRADIVPFVDVMANHWAYFQIVEASNTHEFYRTEQGKVDETWDKLLQTWKQALANR